MSTPNARKTKRYAFALLVTLLACCLLLIGGLVVVAQSEAANRWLLQTVSSNVDSLSFDHIQGDFAQGIQFDMAYEDSDVTVLMDHLNIQLDHQCFWQLLLCVSKLHIKRLSIHVISEENELETDPVELPVLRSPILIHLQQGRIDEFVLSYNHETLLREKQIQFNAEWINTRLKVNELHSKNDYCGWRAEATLRFRDNYPLEALLQCQQLKTMAENIALNVNGDLSDLSITGNLIALVENEQMIKVPLALELELDTLTDNLPLSLNIHLEESITLMPSPRISISQFQVQGVGDLDEIRLQSEFITQMEQLENDIHVKLDASTNFNELNINRMLTEVADGRVTTQGTLEFSPNLTWRGESQIEHFSLAHLNNALDGFVQGSVHHNFKLENEQPVLAMTLENWNGALSGYPWQAQGNLGWQDNTLTVKQLAVTQVDNQISAKGTWSSDSEANLNVDFEFPSLQRIVEEMGGHLSGKLKVGGNALNPDISGTITGRDLNYADLSVAVMESHIEWITDKRADNKVKVKLKGLKSGEQMQADVLFNLVGSLEQHSISLSASDTLNNRVALGCQASFSASSNDTPLQYWQADCSRFDTSLAHPTQAQVEPWVRWKLQHGLKIKADTARPEVNITPFCLTSNNSLLCLESDLVVNEQGINDLSLNAERLPFSLMAPWLPANLQVSGTADAQGLLSQNAANIEFKIGSKQASFTYNHDSKNPIRVEFETLNTQFQRAGDSVDMQWQVQSLHSGQSQGNLTLKGTQVGGNLSLQQLNLAPISKLFLTEENDLFSGLLEADIELSGSLEKPRFEGTATLSEGMFQHDSLPEKVENITIRLQASPDYQMRFEGDFLVQNNQGTLSGVFDWKEEWWSQLNINANNLIYQPEDNITVYLSPKLSTRISAREINISGEVIIPEARVHLQSLPEQAISLSQDAEIVGSEQPDSITQEITSQVTLILGERVRFKGFGLDTHLEGRLGVKQNPGSPIVSSGIIRLEKGSYQAYGQTLSISEGDLVFIDDIDNPLLRLSAVRDRVSDNVVVGVKVNGRASNPEVEFFSIPDMPQQEQIHYLVTGRAPNTEASPESSIAAEAAISMALEARTGRLTRKAGDMLGIEDLALSTGSTEDRSEVGISGYITPDLMIRYGVGMFEAVNTITLNYRIRNNLYFEVISGKSNAVDLLWSFDRD